MLLTVNVEAPSEYVNVNGALPVNVTLSVLLNPRQSAPPPLITAVGNGLITTLTGLMVTHPNAVTALI